MAEDSCAVLEKGGTGKWLRGDVGRVVGGRVVGGGALDEDDGVSLHGVTDYGVSRGDPFG